MHKRSLLQAAVLAAMVVHVPGALAQSEIRIAHVYSKTGPLEAYGKQTQAGLLMGLEYATGGSMTVAGKKLVLIEKDDQGKPDLGKSLLAAAYSDDKADLAVGPSASGVTWRLPRPTTITGASPGGSMRPNSSASSDDTARRASGSPLFTEPHSSVM